MKKCISYSKKFKGLLKGIGIKKKSWVSINLVLRNMYI